MKRIFALAFVALLGAAGCEASPEAEIHLVCSSLCSCDSALPALQRACADQCVEELENTEIPPGCADCLTTLTCSELGANDLGRCEPLCDRSIDDGEEPR